ncbi:Protein phosphatase 2C-2 [Entamoeba marina]
MELYLRPNYKYTDYDLNHLYIPDCFDVQKSFEYNDINLTIQMLPHTKCTIKDIESITSQINSPYVLIYAISLHDCLTLQTQSEPQSTLSFIENLTTSSSTKNASHTFVVITKWDTLNPKQFITHSSPTISSENTESIDIARNIRKIFSKYFTVCFTSCHDKLDIDNYFELVLTIIKNIEGKTSNTPTNTPTNNPQPLKVERGHQYLKYSFKEKKKLKCQSGGASEIGVRATNEDTFSLIDNTKKLNVHQLKQTKCSYYAIFDGHNGLETSKNCLELMHQTLFGDIDFESGYFESSLMNTYHLVDWKLCNGKINDDSGTTAVTAIIKDRYLIVGNVGDSECIVAQTKYGMDYEVLTYKHTAKDADEKIRMKNNGGILFNGRVYGSLAVSRSLGDRSYKGKGVVIADPFTKVYELTSKDTFIVLACDGVFEQLSYDNVIEFVAEMQKQGKTPQETANALITESIEKGSKDNSTAIIIYLNWD